MSNKPPAADPPQGIAFALGAYLWWGLLPLYMKALVHIPPAEVLAHRVLWSLPVAALLLTLTRKWGALRAALRSWRLLGMAAATATLLSINWGIYIWAISTERTLEAAMGYFINPLFSILLGAWLLREPLSKLQWTAVGLVTVAVVVFTAEAGQLPWGALGLVLSWSLFALLKKELPLGANEGFFIEIAMLATPALLYLGVAEHQGSATFGHGDWGDSLMLAAAGIVTTVPLVLYGNGAKLLRLSTIGILQYSAPTMIFLIAVFVFHEPFGPGKLVGFVLIWIALLLYTAPMLIKRRATPSS
jgi:chloramphenicol-sensitive protein RarD